MIKTKKIFIKGVLRMIEKQMLVYFVVYVIANFIAILFSSKILNGIYVSFFKLLIFSILFTIVQFILEHFIKINIIYFIFLFPLIYIMVIYTLIGITKLIRITNFGSVLKTSLLIVFFQLCTKGLLALKLTKYLGF